MHSERAACLPRQASVLMDGHGDTVTAPQLIRIDTVDLEGVLWRSGGSCGAAHGSLRQLRLSGRLTRRCLASVAGIL